MIKNLITALLIQMMIILPGTAFSKEDSVNAKLLNPVSGNVSPDHPQPVKLLITNGPAKGCVLSATAVLNRKRLRYEYHLPNPQCQIDGQMVKVGHVVRGQHQIKGTMANSGMGRDYLLSKKGLEVTLAYQ